MNNGLIVVIGVVIIVVGVVIYFLFFGVDQIQEQFLYFVLILRVNVWLGDEVLVNVVLLENEVVVELENKVESFFERVESIDME